jgi:hypothetical protein
VTIRALIGVGLGLVACATLDQPERNGRPLDDGVAPYRRSDRVELCFGPTRVVDVAPASGDQGVCRSEGPVRACARHDDCAQREACICGRCTVQLCRFSRDCRPGHVCGGLSPKRCAPACEGAACEQPCGESAECAAGELCLGGSCKVLACGPAGPSCGAGASCDSQLREATLHAPSAITEGSRTILYLELREGTTTSILRAESEDGVRFSAVPDVPVVTAAGAPSVLLRADGIELYYAVGDASIHRAQSSDGISFEAGAPVLSAEAAWEAGRVSSPGAVRIGPALYLFYEGGDQAGIGLAISADGQTPPVRVGSEPLLVPSSVANPRWTLLDSLGSPAPLVVDGSLRLFAHARGREDTAPKTADGGAAPLNDSIALVIASLPTAGAVPLFASWPYNPVLGGIANLAPIVESEPSVVRVGGQWRLYYESEGKLELATNPP